MTTDEFAEALDLVPCSIAEAIAPDLIKQPWEVYIADVDNGRERILSKTPLDIHRYKRGRAVHILWVRSKHQWRTLERAPLDWIRANCEILGETQRGKQLGLFD